MTFINSVAATGGGDACEDVFGGLEEALKMDWQHKNRILVHIADAPQHGSRFHNCSSDDYSTYNDADIRGLKIEDLLRGIKEKEILYNFCKIGPHTDKMIREFRNTMGDQDIVKEMILSGPEDIMRLCVKIVSLSIDSNIMSTLESRSVLVVRRTHQT